MCILFAIVIRFLLLNVYPSFVFVFHLSFCFNTVVKQRIIVFVLPPTTFVANPTYLMHICIFHKRIQKYIIIMWILLPLSCNPLKTSFLKRIAHHSYILSMSETIRKLQLTSNLEMIHNMMNGNNYRKERSVNCTVEKNCKSSTG